VTSILPIVEGDGDIAAVPELIRRIAYAHGKFDIEVSRPHKRGDLPKVMRRFDDFLQTALLERSPIIWVLDYDCAECIDHVRDARLLNARAKRLAGTVLVEFVFMIKEFETLFLADELATRAVFADIPTDLAFPKIPESIRDAKGWISAARPSGSAYKPMSHQQRVTAQLDLDRLRAGCDSFRRFEAAVLRLIDS
jgi:Domain of unknown function (DUF4276)